MDLGLPGYMPTANLRHYKLSFKECREGPAVNLASTNEHVPELEQRIRVMKE
jgi:hypothetical protein